jgi:hypothetical protein
VEQFQVIIESHFIALISIPDIRISPFLNKIKGMSLYSQTHVTHGKILVGYAYVVLKQ